MESLLFNLITPQAYIELRSNISNGEADFTFIPSVAKATAPLTISGALVGNNVVPS